jgi:hypothetical protein
MSGRLAGLFSGSVAKLGLMSQTRVAALVQSVREMGKSSINSFQPKSACLGTGFGAFLRPQWTK